MRLPLSQLERARRRPKAFAAAQIAGFKGMRPTFFGYWVFAAKWYHKFVKINDPRGAEKAHDYLLQHCRAKLSNDAAFDSKMAQYATQLDRYIESHTKLNQPTIQTNKRVQMKVEPNHLVSGTIGRLDIIPAGGFAATNFELRPSDWQAHLRTPIIQQALAEELGRSSSEIQVGMYCIESGEHEYVSLSATEIQDAVKELEKVLNSVQSEMKKLHLKSRSAPIVVS